MHLMSKVVGVKILAAAAALGVVGWLSADGEVSAQTKQQHHHHPRLHRAMHELRQARHNLKEASGDFGGHRAEALRDVDRAIEQVERALRYSRHHSGNGSKYAPSNSGVGTSRGTTRSPGTGISTRTASRGSQKGILIIPQK
jgi:hypothetical protein